MVSGLAIIYRVVIYIFKIDTLEFCQLLRGSEGLPRSHPHEHWRFLFFKKRGTVELTPIPYNPVKWSGGYTYLGQMLHPLSR